MFKRIILLCLVCLLSVSSFAKKIDMVHPTFWWTGMKNTELQVLLHGENLAGSTVTLSTDKVKVNEVISLENPNYLVLYLDLSNAAPEQFSIQLKQGKKITTIPYELKERTSRVKAQGFTSEDVLYLIMPDRFANGNTDNDVVKSLKDKNWNRSNPSARHGGDIAGVAKHMDYLSDLGVTAVWLNPVQENDMPETSYHGYAITDYYKVDERIGTNDEFVEFVDQSHKSGLKVVMDMIFNHCGSEHVFFKDKPMHDWFNFQDKFEQTSYKTIPQFDPYASKYDMAKAVDGWFVSVMPDLNHRNRHVARYLVQNSIWWIEYGGIDGIRQDTHPYADFDFMAEWCKEVRDEYPKFSIVGETWVNSNVGVSFWQENSKIAYPRNSHLPVVMDFPMQAIVNQAFDEETTDWSRGLSRIYEYLAEDIVYANPNNLLIFFDNHDTNRFNNTQEKAQNVKRYKQALAFLLTTRGIPQLYYGTEVAMVGDKGAGDGFVREDFPGGWDEDKSNLFDEAQRNELQADVFNYTRKLLNWRKGNQVISEGKLLQFSPNKEVYIYLRQLKDKSVLVVLNGSDSNREIELKRYEEILSNFTSGTDVISEKAIDLKSKSLSIEGRGAYVLELN